MSAVLIEMVTSHVALVTINRPAAKNAVNVLVVEGLVDAIARIELDLEIRVVILTGAGGEAFSAGADLKDIAAGLASQLRTREGGFAGFVFHPKTCVWIAAVEGLALGGGFELALACDMIIASNTARFALPEVSRGMIAGGGGVVRLMQALPPAIARELIATGEWLGAERAVALGLINHCVQPGDAVKCAIDIALRVALNAPLAVRTSLALARDAFHANSAEIRRLNDEAKDSIALTADFIEGPRAFMERRIPSWRGC